MMKKSMFVFLLLASPAFAQSQQNLSTDSRSAAGCGPGQIQFAVQTAGGRFTVAKPEPNKALVYVFETERRNNAVFRVGSVPLGSATIRVGLDGTWVGANHGESFLFFSVEPGDHRLCTDWQSSLSYYSKLAFAVNLTAQPGNVYYFRTKVLEEKERQPNLVLEAVDSAEGQLLLSSSSLSSSRPKK